MKDSKANEREPPIDAVQLQDILQQINKKKTFEVILILKFYSLKFESDAQADRDISEILSNTYKRKNEELIFVCTNYSYTNSTEYERILNRSFAKHFTESIKHPNTDIRQLLKKV